MRLSLLALLCVGTAAFCQSPAPQTVDPDKLFEMPKKFSPAERGFAKLQPQAFLWNTKTIFERPKELAPRPMLDSPQIDPKIIIHPPWHSQSKGKDVSRHLYPDLKFLPLRHGPQIPQ